MNQEPSPDPRQASPPIRVKRIEEGELARFCTAAFLAAGADEATGEAATRAMLHASRTGVDSHGVRLLPHYLRSLAGGRVNPRPAISFPRSLGATAVLDADNGHGALAAYAAMERAVELSRLHGVGAVAIRRSSHFGAAGAYAMFAAERGVIGLATCHSDKIVRLHSGAEPFHGTNPVAFAAPVPGERPWLLDMATSAIPFNRVQLYGSLGLSLPAGVASDADGRDTDVPQAAAMLAPLGGEFGFKGAALAGVAEILSSALTGMQLGHELLAMGGPDFATPRGLGAFVLALAPEAFAGEESFGETMLRYVRSIRSSRPVAGGTVMAPGDREWAEADVRRRTGIPVDVETCASFECIARDHNVRVPRYLTDVAQA